MTLKEQLQQALAGMSPFSTGEQTIALAAGPQRLECQLVALGPLGCAFHRLALGSDRVAAMSTGQLQTLAADLASKLTYLLEPISPIETDAHGCVVQMRSNPPQKESDRTSYYELLVSRSGELSLARYTRAAGQQREVIPAEVTREVLARLVGDFSSVVS
jgi:hypothetical protein